MLFENNNFIDYDNFDDYNLNLFGLIKENDEKLYDLKNGFLRGNMFKDIYDHYKENMILNFIPQNNKEELLLKIYELDFAITDISLYLDIHNDHKIYEIFKNYVKEYNKKVEEYEKNYGPLNLNYSNYTNYKWLENPWPWDRSGGKFNV